MRIGDLQFDSFSNTARMSIWISSMNLSPMTFCTSFLAMTKNLSGLKIFRTAASLKSAESSASWTDCEDYVGDAQSLGMKSSGVSEEMNSIHFCWFLVTSGNKGRKSGLEVERSSRFFNWFLDSFESRISSESVVSINLGVLTRFKNASWNVLPTLIYVSLNAKIIRSASRREFVTF